MGFHDDRFPTGISYGSRGGPSFSTSIIKTDSGAEERVSRWAEPHYVYDAKYGIKTRDQVYALYAFYVARRGPENSFPYKDFMDFASTANGRTSPVAVSYNNQLLGLGDGTRVDFQLRKAYTSGSTTRYRTIRLPVVATVKVAFDGVEQTSGWSVSRTTGVVTFTTPPGVDVEVTAGFEFDVMLRFGDQVDEAGLQASIDHYDTASIPSIPLVEDVTTFRVDEDYPYRGHGTIGISADVIISILDGGVQTLVPTSGGFKARLPEATLLPRGGVHVWLVNPTAFTVTIADFTGASLFTLPAASGGVAAVATILLGEVTGVPTWRWF